MIMLARRNAIHQGQRVVYPSSLGYGDTPVPGTRHDPQSGPRYAVGPNWLAEALDMIDVYRCTGWRTVCCAISTYLSLRWSRQDILLSLFGVLAKLQSANAERRATNFCDGGNPAADFTTLINAVSGQTCSLFGAPGRV